MDCPLCSCLLDESEVEDDSDDIDENQIWLQLVMPYEGPQVATRSEIETWTFRDLYFMHRAYRRRCETLAKARGKS